MKGLALGTDVPILVPRRAGDPHRDMLWEFVCDWYEREVGFPIFEGHHDEGLFSRSAAINRAARDAGDWGVAIVADGDVILGSGAQVKQAAEMALDTGQMVYAHDVNHQMSRHGTERILAGNAPNPEHAEQVVANTWSSCQAIRRDLWERIGGFDERLEGWGWDDLVLMACATALGGIDRAKGPMFHLWHERKRSWQEGNAHYKENEQFGRRFMDARNDPDAIRYLLAERRLQEAGAPPAFGAGNLGKWDSWHGGLKAPHPYADTATYGIGADWLKDCALVEDWGAGGGWMRGLIGPERYRGIDGSSSPFAEEIADLADYRSEVPGVFIRHVLEHDFRWAQILDNALASFTERMVLVLFTPLSENGTHDLEWEDPPGVPNLSFALSDITNRFGGLNFEMESVESPVKYGGPETVFRINR